MVNVRFFWPQICFRPRREQTGEFSPCKKPRTRTQPQNEHKSHSAVQPAAERTFLYYKHKHDYPCLSRSRPWARPMSPRAALSARPARPGEF